MIASYNCDQMSRGLSQRETSMNHQLISELDEKARKDAGHACCAIMLSDSVREKSATGSDPGDLQFPPPAELFLAFGKGREGSPNASSFGRPLLI